METAPKSALALATLEAKIETHVAEYGRELYRTKMQPLADALPRLGVSAEAAGRAAAGGR